jgi:hypothetical protein
MSPTEGRTIRHSLTPGQKDSDLPEEGDDNPLLQALETSSTDKDGKRFYECRIEVQAIKDVEEETEAPAKGSDKSVSDILDSLMEKHMESKVEEKY